MCKKLVLLIVLCVVLGLVGSVSAAVYWDNDAGNQKWEDPLNWSGDAGPTDSPAVNNISDGIAGPIIGTGVVADEPTKIWLGNNPDTSGELLIDGGDLIAAQFVEIGYNGIGFLTINSGTITTGKYDVMIARNVGTQGQMDISGGTVTAQRFFCVGDKGTGTFNMTGGTININQYDFQIADDAGSVGEVNLHGGVINCGRDFTVGGAGVGTLNMYGGVINAPGKITIPELTGGNGTLNFYGGTINAKLWMRNLSFADPSNTQLVNIHAGTFITADPNGDIAAEIQQYVDLGWVVGYDGAGTVNITWDGVGTTTITASTSGVTIPVDPNGDIAAANEIAQPGDTIEIAAGTFVLAEQIAIKDGVTYKGAGAGLTIIDGNDVTRAFVVWGDRGATDGQVDANGVGISNATGPKDWVLDGLTIQNCVADTLDRQDILSAARDLLNNYTGTPYTLEAAQTENGGISSNPGWFDILSGGADNDLTDVELQAYLDANPVGSTGHLVVNNNQDNNGGAITIHNQAVGTIQNCEFLNNYTPAEGAGNDGGAINITGLSIVTINDCLFDGNYAVSKESVAVDGLDGDGGHIAVQGGSASALTPGTTLNANRCVFLNGNASDDGGAIRTGAAGSIVRLDACWFEANTSWDNGNVLAIGNESSGELTVTNCIFANNITKADNSPDRMIETRRNSKFINCTFVGNNQEDQDMIYNNANTADTDADGVDDETADTTQVVNCIFVNNVMGNGDDVLGSRNANFTIAATNCLFFGNTLQNGNAADNTQRPEVETGSVMADPLLDANHVPGAGSPAIDAGVDPATVGVTVTTDYNGDPRPQGAAYDIGAYESPAN